MAKKQINRIKDKLVSVNENFSINMYDNGFMLEINGKDSSDEWKTVKIMCSSLAEVQELVKEAAEMDRND